MQKTDLDHPVEDLEAVLTILVEIMDTSWVSL